VDSLRLVLNTTDWASCDGCVAVGYGLFLMPWRNTAMQRNHATCRLEPKSNCANVGVVQMMSDRHSNAKKVKGVAVKGYFPVTMFISSRLCIPLPRLLCVYVLYFIGAGKALWVSLSSVHSRPPCNDAKRPPMLLIDCA
jgi:hypothetical protein